MAKYDSTIFGEARSETADRRSGRTERITRNESSADFLLAISQPVRQTFYLQSGNRLGSRDRPSGTPSSPANGRAGFVPFGLGPEKRDYREFSRCPDAPAGLLAPLFEPRQRTVLPPTRPAAVAYRFRSERPATSSYDRRTSLLISLSGTSRSKRTLIQCRLFIW